jgi:polyhydroxyalkanoate synthesis regulator phasin
MANKRIKTAGEIAQQKVAEVATLTEETMDRANSMIERNPLVRTVTETAEQVQAEAAALTEDALVAFESAAERNSFLDMYRKAVLAAMGGVAMAWEESEETFNRMVKRGEATQRKALKQLKKVAEKRQPREAGDQTTIVEEVLDRLDIPSKTDIEALSSKISDLTIKVEELKHSQN